MDVCHIINNLEENGAQVFLKELILNQPSRVQTTVCHFGPESDLAKNLKKEITVQSLPPHKRIPQLSLRPPLELLMYVRKNEFDVLHTHLPYSHIIGRMAASLSNTPVIATHHSFPKNYNIAERILNAITAPVDNCTTAVSYAIADKMSTDVVTIQNGIDIDSFQSNVCSIDRKSVREDLGLRGTVFLNVGRYHPIKNQEALIRAFSRARETIDEAHLVLLGDGKLENDLRAVAAELGLTNIVHFLGPVPRNEVFRYYAASDAFVLPSKIEGMPISLIEAMAAGLPIIASDIPGTRSLINDEEHGLLIDTGNISDLAEAMIRISNQEYRIKLADASLDNSKNFHIAKTSSDYERIYHQILNNSVEESSSF